MTRRRIIAGVILLAALAVAVPFAPGVWERVAYVQVPTSIGPVKVVSDRVRFTGRSDVLGLVLAALEGSTLRVHEKRHPWLPGQAFIVPDQVCVACKLKAHSVCFPRHTKAARFITTPDGTRVKLPETFRCTCTDPSHDGE